MVGRQVWYGLILLAAFARPAAAGVRVDLQLVLAVDVSLSMAEDETKLQRKGYAAALRDPRLVDAIRGSPLGRIAVAYVEWSSVTDQRLLVDWHLIDSTETANAVAVELERAVIKTGTTTSISAGLDFSAKLIGSSPYESDRRVIDISGDGYSDYGRPVQQARDDAVRSGITINGLPVMNQRASWRESAPPDLDNYYRDNVIGGPGSFTVVVRDLKDFDSAVLRKLILEVAGFGGALSRPVVPG